MPNKDIKKAKIKISKEDWKAIKGLTKSHNQSLHDPLDAVTTREMTAFILHLALTKFTPSEIITFVRNEMWNNHGRKKLEL